MSAKKMIKVTLVGGTPRTRGDHRATVRGLGLKWKNHTVEVEDTPSTRGLVLIVRHLVKVDEHVSE